MDLRLTDPATMALAAGAVVVVALLAWLFVRRRRTTTANLRRRFGPEYERTVQEHGSQRRAEAQLTDRERRVDTLTIRELDPAERARFSGQWQSLQSRFVDDPKRAVTEADELVSSLMQARGYPVADFSQRAADVSVDHSRLVTNYRAAHDIAVRLGTEDVGTEDPRTATIHYRALFEELVHAPTAVETREVA